MKNNNILEYTVVSITVNRVYEILVNLINRISYTNKSTGSVACSLSLNRV